MIHFATAATGQTPAMERDQEDGHGIDEKDVRSVGPRAIQSHAADDWDGRSQRIGSRRCLDLNWRTRTRKGTTKNKNGIETALNY